MSFLIRKMDLEDLDMVVEVEKQCFNTPWSLKSFEFEIKSNPIAHYLVAVKDEEIIGYAGIWNIVDQAHVTNICLLDKYRGLGYGKELFSKLIQLVITLGAQTVSLEVRESNIVAQNLYKSFGFLEEGIRKKYYIDNGEDAIIMVMKVKDR